MLHYSINKTSHLPKQARGGLIFISYFNLSFVVKQIFHPQKLSVLDQFHQAKPVFFSLKLNDLQIIDIIKS